MKTIVIDDEPWMLRHFSDECAGIDEIELVGSFRNPLKALEFAKNNAVELAFVDMMMPQLNGAETAERLREILGGVKIIFTSACSESYAKELYGRFDCGYLYKPYKRDDLRTAVNKIISK